LYTRDFPTDGIITAALKPFNGEEYYSHEEEEVERPLFTWDYWVVGGRYGGLLKLNSTLEKYEPYCFSPTKRAGRLFRSALFERVTYGCLEFSIRGAGNKIEEVYAMEYCGAREGELRVDGAWIPDITNFDEISDNCFCMIDIDGTAYARDIWNGKTFITTEDFDCILKKIAEKNCEDCFLTVIDLHN
jgi:hypothetical protein